MGEWVAVEPSAAELPPVAEEPSAVVVPLVSVVLSSPAMVCRAVRLFHGLFFLLQRLLGFLRH